MKNYSEITFKYLRVQKKRTIFTILGIALSVGLITAIGTMGMSLRDKLIRQAIANTGDYHVSFSKVSGKDINKIENNVEVQSTGITDKEGTGIISDISAKEKEMAFIPHRYLNIKGYGGSALEMFSTNLREGRMPKTSKEITLDYWALKYLPGNPKIGDKIKMTIGIRKDLTGAEMDESSMSSDEVFDKTGEKEYTIVGLLEPKVFVSTAYMANGITGIDNIDTLEGKNYNVFIRMNSLDNVQSKAAKIVLNLNQKPAIEYNNDLINLYGKGVNKQMNLSYLIAVAFVIVLIIICTIAVIYNAFNISVLERISQFGILRCIGTTPSQLKSIVLKEAAILSVIGIPIGLFLGVFSMKLILYIVGVLNFQLLADVKIVISPVILIVSILLGIFTIYLSAAGPARQAAKVSPLEAVRNSGSVKVEEIKKIKKARLAKAIFKIEGQFANRNLRRNKKRFRITIFSMIISIVLFIVFGSLMEYSFRVGVADTNDPVSYNLWNNSHSAGIDDKFYNEISNILGVEKVYKFYQCRSSSTTTEDKINSRYEELSGKSIVKKTGTSREINNVNVISYGDEGLASLKKNLKSGSINKDALNKENGVILVQTANIVTKDKKHALIDVTKYKVGDEINVSGMSDKKLKVMAILSKGILDDEYNNKEGLVLISTDEVFKKITGFKNYMNLLIVAKPNVSHSKIKDYLNKVQANNPGYFYTDNEAAATLSRDNNITISIFLYGFIGVISLIGCLNIENTISTNLLLRTKEFAVLKAVGMTQGAIKKMILLEGVFYGLLAALYGGILGTILYYLLFKFLIGIQEVKWVMPWKNILISVIGGIAVALVSSLLPLKKINSGIIVEDLRVDN